MNTDQVSAQQAAFDDLYNNVAKYSYHISSDRLMRYISDRRLNKALEVVKIKYSDKYTQFSILVVCGGVGGEGIFFIRSGFKNVTVTDISEKSLVIANKLNKELKTIQANAEELQFADCSYDIVIVQDGLHHLPRPALGFTEMLRVAKKAVIIIEPQKSLVGKVIGTEWEVHGTAVNYVFRWSKNLLEQLVKSYLLKNYSEIRYLRYWNHNLQGLKLSKLFPKRFLYPVSRLIYSLLTPFNFCGNMMTAVVFK